MPDMLPRLPLRESTAQVAASERSARAMISRSSVNLSGVPASVITGAWNADAILVLE
jgi:hypothetical protein